MDGFGIRRGRVFPQVQDSEEYLLFSTDSNPDPNIFIVIPSPPGTGPAASTLFFSSSPPPPHRSHTHPIPPPPAPPVARPSPSCHETAYTLPLVRREVQPHITIISSDTGDSGRIGRLGRRLIVYDNQDDVFGNLLCGWPCRTERRRRSIELALPTAVLIILDLLVPR